MTERFKLTIDHLELSVSAFAKSIGVSQQMLFNYTKGRIPSLEVVQKILTTYPQFSAEWLVLGEGEMLRNHTIIKQGNNNNNNDNNDNTIMERLLEQLKEKEVNNKQKDEWINRILDELSGLRKENSKLVDTLIKK